MTTLQPTSGGATDGMTSSSWKAWLPAIVAIVLLAGLAWGVPGLFTLRSIQNMLIQIGPLGLVALGQCLVILVRGLDLSVASVMATAAVIAASFGPSPAAFPMVVVCVLAMSITVGAVNGLLVTKRKLEPFLVTLATMIMLQGIRSAVTEGAPLGDTPMVVRALGRGIVWGIPINAILLGVTACVLAFVLRRTVIGRKVYIVGTNDRAAFLTGINPDRIRIGCYIGCSILAGMAGVVLAGYLDQVDNWVGRGYELDSIVAAVLGGVALAGGKGGAFGALAGAVLLILLSNAILHLGIPVEFQMIMKGVIVVGAVAFYAMRGR
jgi:ribose/xylose/arabinose/galactoside ABC-type transport system permease subunit